MTDQDRKDLREFIRRVLEDIANGNDARLNSVDAAYLLRVLAEPRLPREPDEAIMRELFMLGYNDPRPLVAYHARLYAKLTTPDPPQPALRDVEVWYVEYAWHSNGTLSWQRHVSVHDTDSEANGVAAEYCRHPSRYAEVVVTGPHKRRVPA